MHIKAFCNVFSGQKSVCVPARLYNVYLKRPFYFSSFRMAPDVVSPVENLCFKIDGHRF